jgi:hypothetical protein
MKRKIIEIISLCFLLAVLFINLDLSSAKNQNNELFLKNILALVKANAESDPGECTRDCFDAKCNPVWTNDKCQVTCGTTSCTFLNATKIE